jgi:hypothetical protein
MKIRSQVLAVVALLIILAATLIVFLTNIGSTVLRIDSITPGYLLYRGNRSKIYLISATSSHDTANETYGTVDGQTVQKGSPLFTIKVTLRNDYTADEPAPPIDIPIAPADGTAYVFLTAHLFGNAGAINTTNITAGDFSLPSTSGTGLVLASGQTASANIYMATNHANIYGYNIGLIFLGDSIPR